MHIWTAQKIRQPNDGQVTVLCFSSEPIAISPNPQLWKPCLGLEKKRKKRNSEPEIWNRGLVRLRYLAHCFQPTLNVLACGVSCLECGIQANYRYLRKPVWQSLSHVWLVVLEPQCLSAAQFFHIFQVRFFQIFLHITGFSAYTNKKAKPIFTAQIIALVLQQTIVQTSHTNVLPLYEQKFFAQLLKFFP